MKYRWPSLTWNFHGGSDIGYRATNVRPSCSIGEILQNRFIHRPRIVLEMHNFFGTETTKRIVRENSASIRKRRIAEAIFKYLFNLSSWFEHLARPWAFKDKHLFNTVTKTESFWFNLELLNLNIYSASSTFKLSIRPFSVINAAYLFC